MFDCAKRVSSAHGGLLIFLMCLGCSVNIFAVSKGQLLLSVQRKKLLAQLLGPAVAVGHTQTSSGAAGGAPVAEELTLPSQMDELTQQQGLAFHQQQEKLGTQTKFMAWILQG